MAYKINKRGQVTIWIIVAIAIVAVISLIFVVQKKPVINERYETQSPGYFLDACARKAVRDASDIMIPQGGLLNPSNVVIYNNVSIPYICQNTGFFTPCIHQHPSLLKEMEDDLQGYLQPKMEKCFSDLIKDMQRRNVEVTNETIYTTVKVESGKIKINMFAPITTKEKDVVQHFSYFESEIPSSMYDLGKVALDITKREALDCYFEYVGYMAIYPRFVIEKKTLRDGTNIYSILDTKSNDKMNMAVRGCAIPAGI